MLRMLSAIVFLASCARPLNAIEPVQVSLKKTPWCFSGTGLSGNKQVDGLFCTDHLTVCKRVQKGVIRFGRFKGVKSVTECARVNSGSPSASDNNP